MDNLDDYDYYINCNRCNKEILNSEGNNHWEANPLRCGKQCYDCSYNSETELAVIEGE